MYGLRPHENIPGDFQIQGENSCLTESDWHVFLLEFDNRKLIGVSSLDAERAERSEASEASTCSLLRSGHPLTEGRIFDPTVQNLTRSDPSFLCKPATPSNFNVDGQIRHNDDESGVRSADAACG
jgi:hypothetical protein